MKKICFLGLLAFGTILNSGAQTDTVVSSHENEWQFEVTPYVWIAGFRAVTDFRQGLSTQVEADFSKIREKLELTGSLHAEVSNGRFFFMGDLIYFRSDKGGFLDTEPTQTRLFIDQWAAELGGGYNFVNNDNAFLVDGLIGWRNFNIDSRLTIDSQEEFDRKLIANDLFVGARMKIYQDRWSFILRGDMGGFGWGSDLSWRINALGGYQFSELFTFKFGLQALSIDYRKDTYGLEMLTTGLTFGGEINF